MSNRPAAPKDPTVMEEDLQALMEGIIGEEYIRNECGTEDLTTIKHLTLVIDTTRQSFYDPQEYLPNLLYLVLDNSTIASIRDLGVGLRFLKSLSLACCGLSDIDGIGVLTGLQELCLSDNYIDDVTPLAMHEGLQTLNLSGNKISDISAADSLSTCTNLRALFLSRNPLCKSRNYRLIVASLIPGLQMLDGSPVDPSASKKVTNGMILECAAELRTAEEDLDDEMRLENDILGDTGMLDAAKREAAVSAETTTAGLTEGIPDTGSELTHGSSVVLAGNMASAVRRRRQHADKLTNSTDCQLQEYESTLDMLDAAILPSSNKDEGSRPSSHGTRTTSRSESFSGPAYFKEGDVTSLFADKDLAVDIDYTDAERPAMNGSASPQISNRVRGVSPARRTGRQESTGASMSFEAEPSRTSSSQRPKTAANSLGTVKRQTSGTSTGIASPAHQLSSPRQRNSSRPQSAASIGSSSSPQHASTRAAPFKIAMAKDAPTSNVLSSKASDSPIHTFPPIKSGAVGSSIVHLDIVRRAGGGYMIADDDSTLSGIDGASASSTLLEDQEKEDSDAEDIAVTHAARHRLMAASASAGSLHSTTSTLKARQHILQQLKATSTAQSVSTMVDEQSQAEEEDEEPSFSRKGFKSLVDTSESSVGAFSHVGIAARGSAKKQARGKSHKSDDVLESVESPQRPPTSSRRLPESAAKDTLSSKAGMSLGFNLAGSLAAIDKWVQDMGSEDETEGEGHDTAASADDSDDEQDDYQRPTGRELLFSFGAAGVAGRRADKKEDIIANPLAIDAHSKDSVSANSEYSNGSTRSRNKILSRDTILSMCSNSGNADGAVDLASDSEDSELGYRSSRAKRTDAAAGTGGSSDNSARVRVSDAAAPTPSATSPRAQGRTRGADVKNRLSGSRSSRTSTNGSATSSVVTESPTAAPVAAEAKSKSKDSKTVKSLPDFPSIGAKPVADRSEGSYMDTPVLEVSPPRYTAAPVEPVVAAPTAAARESSNSVPGKTAPKPSAVSMSDEELVDLLRRPPKDTMALKTKNAFQEFFRGVSAQRMQSLLEQAYVEIADEGDRNAKIGKRMDLLRGVIS